MEITLDTIRDIKIYQSRKGYRFSVDALLLYSFVNLKTAKRIADFGAGSGIIGILLAKKYPQSQVVLVELQEGLAELAERNVRENCPEGRVNVVRRDIRDLAERGMTDRMLKRFSYDLVVSNPPFRRPKTGLMSPEEEKAVARHELRLKLSELARASSLLLRTRGRFLVIYHPERLAELMDALRERGMEAKRLRFVHASQSSEAKMVLVEAVKEARPGLMVERPCFIYREDGGYSEELRELCSGSDYTGCSDEGSAGIIMTTE
ncbi:MAG TPA: tRNA1(Val) (adenine(37)-N6)-methyltransferase [Thermodesulfovibrionales bacterium]|jgi:tRNA1Val (adenine37-N6)-methyltransferase|nr:tRNA1(Val) (adenine(37)-N6)-methyltransferase [Thermodesulfovibrionales bacterium]